VTGLRVLPLAALAASVLAPLDARGEVTAIDGTTAPIVRVNIRQGDVTIRTWNRASVLVEAEPGLSIARHTMRDVSERTSLLVMETRASRGSKRAKLPTESFVLAPVPGGAHEAIVIKSTPRFAAGAVVVTIPADAVTVLAFARGGNLDVHDYRGGTLVGFTTAGRLVLHNVGGTVFAQTGTGTLFVSDAATERLRARSLFGNVVFERCLARQIEASSVEGAVVYDDGRFEPGLARFESTHGDVAIGTRNAAELEARVAGEGRVYTNFERGARIVGRRDDARAIVGAGGPVVTASTNSGNVYLFDGTLRTREHLPRPWQVPISALPHALVLRVVPTHASSLSPFSGPADDTSQPVPTLALPPPQPLKVNGVRLAPTRRPDSH